MGVRDALLLNTTGSNFEALQSNETARIKGDFSIKNTSDTEVFGVDVSAAEVNITANITSSGDISGSETSTGSFGRVVASTFLGDGIEIRDSLTRSSGLVTASAQIASDISGAFDKGFFFGFQASSSISGGLGITGSFGRLEGVVFNGDGSNIKSTLPRSTGILTSSAQIAADISGSFNKGFEYEGIIKGASVTANGTWSTGGALALSITYHAVAGDKSGAISAMGVRGSWPTGYFAVPAGINTDCNEEYNGSTWSEANNNNTARARAAAAGGVNAGLFFGGLTSPWYGASSAATETYNGTNWSEVNDMIIPRRAHLGSGTQNAALAIGGYKDGNHNPTDNPAATPTMDCNVEQWNGTNWSNNGQAPTTMKRGAAAGSVNTTLVFGTSNSKTETYEWDGSSWSEGGAHPSRQDVGGGGSSNDAISFGSYPASSEAATYDGSTWSETGDTIVSNGFTGMGANQQAASTAIAVGGQAPAPAGVACTEEYTGGESITSGSFGRLDAITLSGDATGLQSTLPYSSGLVTASAQLSADISGSFNKGFGFGGEISGSETSTGSFGRIVADTFHGDATPIRDTFPLDTGIVSGSVQLAADISGSFNKGFGFASTSSLDSADGSLISSSALSVDNVFACKYGGDGSWIIPLVASGLVSGSAQLASDISGSFNKGFTHENQISGSLTSSGSFGQLLSDDIRGDGSELTNIQIPSDLISGSITISGSISGSFNKGFRHSGTIKTTAGGVFSTGASLGRTVRFLSGLGSVNAAHAIGGNAINTPQALSEEYDGSSWSEGGELPAANTLGGTSGTVNAGLYFGGFPQGDETFTYNGSNFSETTDLPGSSGAGTVGAGSNQGSALAMIGTSANQLNDAYEWNGSNWSEISAIGTNRGRNQGGGESSEAALVVGGDDTPTCVKTNQTEIWNGSNWSDVASTSHARRYGAFAGTTNDGIVMGDLNNTGVVELWDGTAWTETSALISSAGGHGTAASGRVGVGTLAGGAHKFGGGVFSTPASELFSAFTTSGSFGRIQNAKFFGDGSGIASTLGRVTGLVTSSAQLASDISGSFNKGFELFNSISGSAVAGSGISGSASSTGSFGLVKPKGGGINTKAFQLKSGLFQLPVFDDRDLNYPNYESEQSTGSLSGSVDRVADVIVGQKLGEMWFDSDKNAVGYTYQSKSLTSQSLDFGTFTNISASGAYQSSSQGFFTQSFYNYAVVTCYLTGSISY